VSRTKLLVIGAGPVGLAMARALQAEGIAYDQVDANAGIGGNWHTGVFKTTHIVSSKRSTAYADYPMPEHYADFPSAAAVLAYLQDYACAHGLMRHIELGRRVARTEPLRHGPWNVTFADGETRTYKGLVVCNGHHWDQRWPDTPGTFAGEAMHSGDYRGPDQLRNKRVLVIGGGNSGCDIASEAARVGASSDWSLRSGTWFLPKTAFGVPLMDLPIWGLPVPLQRVILKGIVRALIGDYRRYGLQQPTHKLFERHPTYGGEALGYIRQGLIKPRGAIARYGGSTVHFTDGSAADYDLIVAATGFHCSFPFLPPGLIEVRNDAPQIYGGAFPAGVRNLYVVGASQPRAGFGSIVVPAAKLYARMIRLQDEIEQPLGDLLHWIGETPPDTNLLDAAKARREIWRAERLLWLLPWQSRRMAKAMAEAAGREAASVPAPVAPAAVAPVEDRRAA
jgi:hypothetical protein